VVVVLVTAIHLGHLRYTSGFQIAATAFKIILILILIFATFHLTRSNPLPLAPGYAVYRLAGKATPP